METIPSWVAETLVLGAVYVACIIAMHSMFTVQRREGSFKDDFLGRIANSKVGSLVAYLLSPIIVVGFTAFLSVIMLCVLLLEAKRRMTHTVQQLLH